MILKLINQQWSPEQIACHLRRTTAYHISFQSIYRWIRKDRKPGGSIFKNLRIMPKPRRKRYRSDDSRGVLRGKRLISDRPDRINNRLEFGHWEADTVMGKVKHQCILTLVERNTGLSKVAKLPNRTARLTTAALSKIIAAQPDSFKSITFDNGTEFLSYKTFEDKFPLICYFAYPHHPWERGCVENFNGLLRQYVSKGSSLSNLSPQKLNAICYRLNARPRKRLEFISPKEVSNALL